MKRSKCAEGELETSMSAILVCPAEPIRCTIYFLLSLSELGTSINDSPKSWQWLNLMQPEEIEPTLARKHEYWIMEQESPSVTGVTVANH
jgi:hypothetical protein